MNRTILPVLAALVLVLWAPGSTAAQVLGITGNASYPLRTITVSLATGTAYRFETRTLVAGGSAPADTVLILRRVGAAPGTPPVAGADGCGAEWERSCFDTPIIAAGGSYQLLVRAWTTPNYGQAEVRMQPIGGSWSSLGTVNFGGATVAHSIAPGTAAVRFETMHGHGNVVYHGLWVVPPGRPDWDVRYVAPASTRTTGLAALDIANATSAGLATGLPGFYSYGASLSGGVGDASLTYNVRDASLDYDRDGLSSALEQSLRSCDRPTATTPDGFNCRNVGTANAGVCAAYPSFPDATAEEVCRAALRDTDLDGLPDDLETLGYGLLRLRQWGASPAHHDVFVEIDTLDQDPTIDVAGTVSDCDGFRALGTLDLPGAIDQLGDTDFNWTATSQAPSFFDSVAAVYRGLPSTYNPDTDRGINVHYDVGINSATNPRETRFGAWGGGGTCIRAFDNPDTGAFDPTNCAYFDIYNNAAACPTDPPAGAISNDRKWLFMWALDGPGSAGGQATIAHYGANDVAEHIHELGHVGTLMHSGPVTSYLGYADNESGFGLYTDLGNYRPNHLSRMNYLFDRTGGSRGADAAGSTTLFRSFAFSNGSTGLLSHHVMDEIAPLGRPRAELAAFEVPTEGGTYPEFIARLRDNPLGADVDWNRDGSWAGRTTVNAPATISQSRMSARRRRLTSDLPTSINTLEVAGNGAAVVNGVLMMVNRRVTSGTASIELRADSNSDCNVLPLGRPTATGPYPGCFSHGTTVAVASPTEPLVAVSVAPFNGGGTSRLLLAASVSLPGRYALRFSQVTVSPSSGATEVSISPSSYSAPVGAIAPAPPFGTVGLAEYSGTEVLVAFVGTSGRLQTLRYNPVSGASTAPVDAQLAGGGFITPSISPTLAVASSRIFMAVAGAPDVRLLELNRMTNQWDIRASINRFGLSGTIVTSSEPLVNLVQDLDGERIRVDFLGAIGASTGYLFSWTSGLLSSTSPFPGASPSVSARFTTFNAFSDMTAVFDGRTPTDSLADLRMYFIERLPTVTRIELRPFAVMGDPSVLPDYDEWRALQHGFCFRYSYMAGFAPSTTLGGLIPTPYNYGIPSYSFPVPGLGATGRCGPLPGYLEAPPPGSGGGGSLSGMPMTFHLPNSPEETAAVIDALSRPIVCEQP